MVRIIVTSCKLLVIINVNIQFSLLVTTYLDSITKFEVFKNQ